MSDRVNSMHNQNATIIFGIKNCNTMQKAFTYLNDKQVVYTFHDYKKQGIDVDHLKKWCAVWGWDKVLNKSGLTFKKLTDEQKQDLDEAKAIALMMAQPSMIKRPIVEVNDKIIIGFKVEDYDQIFNVK